ncbi:MAG: DUF763 domain-containing protein [Candidatus Dojkabacteria bacterium]|jgi:hypothetical protein|nr:DUF763 domain-containing protein [Candidatus Dojkabacteria bacterium]
MKTGIANLPLHWGKAPGWLFGRMEKLAREITIAIVSEYGSEEMLKRLSDPYWFQAFGCVLGYDWHSSGLTTTTCGALKSGIKGIERDLNLFIAGGKGRTSRKTPAEIENWGEKVSLSIDPQKLIYASKMSAKVDSAAVQDGHRLYHHNFFFTKEGSWTVIQQGMPALNNPKRKKPQPNYSFFATPSSPSPEPRATYQFARRYHWYSKNVKDFVNEPQSGICDDYKLEQVLNLTSMNSTSARSVVSKISIEKPHKVVKEYKKILTLSLPKREWIEQTDLRPENLEKVMLSTYERQPKDFEELLSIKGIGPKSIRALTLISEIAYGTKADWRDPVKYSFAHGGKDGYPYPVDRENYDGSIAILRKAIRKAKIERSEKRNALMKLL